MQHFPTSPNDNNRRPDASRRESAAIPNIEEHRDQEELDATKDWLAHIAAGRIEVR